MDNSNSVCNNDSHITKTAVIVIPTIIATPLTSSRAFAAAKARVGEKKKTRGSASPGRRISEKKRGKSFRRPGFPLAASSQPAAPRADYNAIPQICSAAESRLVPGFTPGLPRGEYLFVYTRDTHRCHGLHISQVEGNVRRPAAETVLGASSPRQHHRDPPSAATSAFRSKSRALVPFCKNLSDRRVTLSGSHGRFSRSGEHF